jgi:hypothetical protein
MRLPDPVRVLGLWSGNDLARHAKRCSPGTTGRGKSRQAQCLAVHDANAAPSSAKDGQSEGGLLASSSRRRRLIVWFIFGLVVSVIPVLWIFLKLVLKKEPHGTWDVLSTGDLIVISAVLAAASVGELLGRKRGRDLSEGELVIVGATFVLLLCSGWLYAIVSALSDPANRRWPGVFCLVAFAISVVIGASSIWIDTSEEG